MQKQSFKNHSRILPFWHLVLYPVLLLMLLAAIANIYFSWEMKDRMWSPLLVLVMALVIIIVVIKARGFALIAQDRAIRAEESLRYFAITGSLPDNRLSLQQIIALRFASNNELLDLAHRAVEENLTPKEIKKSISHWREDTHRV